MFFIFLFISILQRNSCSIFVECIIRDLIFAVQSLFYSLDFNVQNSFALFFHIKFRRNLHNLPLRRIKEMLNHFEHNVTVESMIEQTRTNPFVPDQSQQTVEQHESHVESTDLMLTSKKSFHIIDDSNILDDVRLCINDMILFLTSNFYQTSLSMSSSDPSLIPSPTVPSTPHPLFHRSRSRFSSTTTSQDHSLANEHRLRISTASFPHRVERSMPLSLTDSTIISKKQRKNKQQQSKEISLNTNNNNNRSLINDQDHYFQQSTYTVCLPEDYPNLNIIDEHNDTDCRKNFIQTFEQRRNFYQ